MFFEWLVNCFLNFYFQIAFTNQITSVTKIDTYTLGIKWTPPKGLYTKITLICSYIQGTNTKLISVYDNKTYEGKCKSQITSLSGYEFDIYIRVTSSFHSLEQQSSQLIRYYVGK